MATIFTQAGEELVADILDASVAQPTWYVGWGTGAGTAAKGDTTLFTEATETRIAATMSQPSADINQAVATITADGTKTITNAGILTAVTTGTLLVHGDHTGVGVVLNDSIQYTIQITWT